MDNTLKFKYRGKILNLAILKNKYQNNGSLYLGLIDVDTNEPFADITVNLQFGMASGNLQYVNTNNFPDITKLIEKYELGSDTGITHRSGYCTYPLFAFDEDKINKYLTNSVGWY